MQRRIIHYDMDYYYAQVMAKYDSNLLGRPVIIGAKPNERGVVATCNYEAREYGVHSGMSSYKAKKLCPKGLFLHPDIKMIKHESDIIAKIAKSFSDVVEFIALDEAYIDISLTRQLFMEGDVKKIALDLKEKIYAATQLTCSVGMGYNKFSSKIASGINKPNGFADFTNQKAFADFLIDKPVEIIYGIGSHIARTLKKHRILTVRQIISKGEVELKRIFGIYGTFLFQMAQGIDDREVVSSFEEKGIGNSRTLYKNISGAQEIKKALIPVVKEASYRLRKKGKLARTITLRIKYSDMKSITRSQTVSPALRRTVDIYNTACKIVDSKLGCVDDIRLVGVRLSNLVKNEASQLDVFVHTDSHKQSKLEKIDNLAFKLRKKYGYDVVSDPFDHLVKGTQFAYSMTKYFSQKED